MARITGSASQRKSTFSDPASCAVVGQDADGNITIHSDLAVGGPVAVFTAEEWGPFIAGVKAGEFDLDEDGGLPPRPGALRAGG